MTLWNLRFAGFEWGVNPQKIYVDQKRIISGYTTASSGEAIENVCEGAFAVSGEGEFAGSDCVYRYELLKKIFGNKKRGLLTLPGMKPFYAYFTSLSLQGDDTPEVLRYKFEFIRDTKKSRGKRFHICKEGESLFEIANLYNADLTGMVKLNPHLKRADGLKERVALW